MTAIPTTIPIEPSNIVAYIRIHDGEVFAKHSDGNFYVERHQKEYPNSRHTDYQHCHLHDLSNFVPVTLDQLKLIPTHNPSPSLDPHSLEAYLRHPSNKNIHDTYYLNPYGTWQIFGEDTNNDMFKSPHTPLLDTIQGHFQTVLSKAVTLKGFWTYGEGGTIRKYEYL